MFRILVGCTALLAGAWLVVLWAAGSHGNIRFDPANAEHCAFCTAILILLTGGTLLLTKGWPFRRSA